MDEYLFITLAKMKADLSQLQREVNGEVARQGRWMNEPLPDPGQARAAGRSDPALPGCVALGGR